jgi:subtilase family serine protease
MTVSVHRRIFLRAAFALGLALALGALIVPARGSIRRTLIAGNHPKGAPVRDWQAAPVGRPLHMTAVLALRNAAELAALKADIQDPGSPTYHKWLSSAEFARRFGPTPEQVRAVEHWLGSSGFTVARNDLATRAIRFTGSVGQAEHAMGIQIVSRGEKYANVNDPEIPSNLGGSIVAVLGLNNLAPAAGANDSQVSHQAASPQPETTIDGETHFGPADFWLFYDEDDPTTLGNNGGTGSPDCIAILEVATLPTIPSPAPTGSVVDIFTSQFTLPAAQIDIEQTGTAEMLPQPSDNEPVLDVDWAHAVAPNTPITLYVSTISGTTTAAFDTLSLAVSQNKCGVISSSIDDEHSTCPDLAQVQAYAQISSQAVTQGQTLFHSSGDYGSNYPCGQPANRQGETGLQPSIEESSANPDITVVGGTQFDAMYDHDGNNTSTLAAGFEQVWQDYTPLVPVPTPLPTPAKGTSGGGISVVFPAPSWQQNIIPYGLNAPLTMRGVPDVSAAASASEPGYWIATTNQLANCPDGETTCFLGDGGTSASAPIWAGISRLIAQNLNITRLGNINPQLYQIAAGNSDAIVDVSVLGNNCTFDTCSAYPGYQVGPGYDLGTGLGSPNINNLIAAFEAPTVGVIATSSNTNTAGLGAQTVSGGQLKAKNTSGQAETISSVTIAASKRSIFAEMSLAASVNGAAPVSVSARPRAPTVTFGFSPALEVPINGTVVFSLSATIGGLAQADRSYRYAGVIIYPGTWPGGFALALALGLVGLAMEVVVENRRRLMIGAIALLLIGATQAGCNSGSGNGGGSPSSSEQTVPAGGIAVSTSAGAVIVQGLPARLGRIILN